MSNFLTSVCAPPDTPVPPGKKWLTGKGWVDDLAPVPEEASQEEKPE